MYIPGTWHLAPTGRDLTVCLPKFTRQVGCGGLRAGRTAGAGHERSGLVWASSRPLLEVSPNAGQGGRGAAAELGVS